MWTCFDHFWVLNECNCDLWTVITNFCSIYVSLLLTFYLKWLPQEDFQNEPNILQGFLISMILLMHLIELAGALLSTSSSYFTILLPSTSVLYSTCSLLLHYFIRKSSKTMFIRVSGFLWGFNGIVRIFRIWALSYLPFATLKFLVSLPIPLLYWTLAYVEVFGFKKHLTAHRVSFYSWVTFFWVTPLLKMGYNCPLEMVDLGSLPEQYNAQNQLNEFDFISNKKSNFWKSLWRFIKTDFLFGGILKLFGDLSSLIGPIEVKFFLDYITNTKPQISSEHPTVGDFLTNGWVIAFIVLTASVGQSIFSQMSTHLVNVRAIQLRTALQAKIYTKLLKIPKNREKEDDVGNIANLLLEDSNNVMSAIGIAHYLWAIPLKISMILLLLYKAMGISTVIGLIITVIIAIPVQFVIGKKMSANASLLHDLTDDRLQKLTNVIKKIKELKMLGWEFKFGEKIEAVRRAEIEALNKDSVYWTFMTVLTHLSAVLIALVSLTIYSLVENKTLTPQSVFAAFALFDQLTVPIFVIPVIMPVFISGLVSGKRLKVFFAQPELKKTYPPIFDGTSFQLRRFRSNSATSIIDSLGGCDDDDDENDEQRYSDDESDEIIQIENAEFSSKQGNFFIDSLNLPKGKLTILGGNSNSGKTLFLSAILGELSQKSGRVSWQRGARIAYVSQQPWLLNGTIRDNILFGKAYRQNRYEQVIASCALQPDLDILPEQDFSEIGDRGVALSGGQRQRIAIARALYSPGNLLIFDDPLSSLDSPLATHVFDTGIRRLTRRGKRTVLLATNLQHLLPQADNIILMESGKIFYHGSPNDLRNREIFFKQLKSTETKDGQTENERRLLGKNVQSRGLESNNRYTQTWQSEEDLPDPLLTRTRTKRHFQTFSEWNYLTPNLSMSTTDEQMPPLWGRTHVAKNKQISRAHSLQVRTVRLQSPVARHLSSPIGSGRQRSKSSAGLHSTLLRHLLHQNLQNKVPLERMASNESNISNATSEIDLSQQKGVDVSLGIPTNEEREYGRIPYQVCLIYAKSAGFKLAGLFLASTIICRVTQVLADLWLSFWTDQNNINETSKSLAIYFLLSTCAFLFCAVSHGIGQYFGAKARENLYNRIFNHMLRCKITVFETTPIGRIMNRFSTDVSIIDKKIVSSLQRLLQFLFLCFSSMLVNTLVSPWFLLIALPVSLVYYYVQKFYRMSSRELQRLENISRSPILSHLLESFNGLVTIRAYGIENNLIQGFFGKLDQHVNAFLLLNASNRWLGIVLDCLGGIIVFFAMVTSLLTARFASISPSLIGMAINYSLLVPIYLNWVVKFLADFEMHLGAVERINRFFKLPLEIDNPENDTNIKENWPEFGEIKFYNVSLSYENSRSVFKDLNLHILPGQKVGICGRSGSGKSTLGLSLLSILNPQHGEIKIDNYDISEIPLAILRKRIAVVPQDAGLFAGTVRDNLDLMQNQTDCKLWECLEKVGLKEFVESVCHGLELDKEINEGLISCGQKQLLNLARAICQEAKIIIMDEATSNLDKSWENLLMIAAKEAFSESTMIIIAVGF